MADKNERKEKDQEAFTEMPNADLPDFEPEQDEEKQVEQFEKTANTGKDDEKDQ